MKEPYGEGLASHTDPESCVDSRKAGYEALTGAHAGGYRAAKFLETRVPTPSPRAEGNTERYASASITRTLRGRRPPHAWKLLAREPGDPTSARHEIVSGPVGEGDEPQVQHERWR